MIVRIAGELNGRILGGRSHRELVEIGAAVENRAGLFELGRNSGVVGREIGVFEKSGGTGARLIENIDVILERDGDPPEGFAEIRGLGLHQGAIKISR